MKITKTQLKQIIKEQLSEAVVGMSASRDVSPEDVLKRAMTAYDKIDEMLRKLMGEDEYEDTLEADMDDIYNAFIQLRAYVGN